jgi:hypothetical protein
VLCGIRLSGETRTGRGRASGHIRRPARLRRPLKIRPRFLGSFSFVPPLGIRFNRGAIVSGPEYSISCCDVPITASGPQGEQPLLNMNNAGKGSRQNGPVTLGKGLALVRWGSLGVCHLFDLLQKGALVCLFEARLSG